MRVFFSVSLLPYSCISLLVDLVRTWYGEGMEGLYHLSRYHSYVFRFQDLNITKDTVVFYVVCNESIAFLFLADDILDIVFNISSGFFQGNRYVVFGEVEDGESVRKFFQYISYLIVGLFLLKDRSELRHTE